MIDPPDFGWECSDVDFESNCGDCFAEIGVNWDWDGTGLKVDFDSRLGESWISTGVCLFLIVSDICSIFFSIFSTVSSFLLFSDESDSFASVSIS